MDKPKGSSIAWADKIMGYHTLVLLCLIQLAWLLLFITCVKGLFESGDMRWLIAIIAIVPLRIYSSKVLHRILRWCHKGQQYHRDEMEKIE